LEEIVNRVFKTFRAFREAFEKAAGAVFRKIVPVAGEQDGAGAAQLADKPKQKKSCC
jgi:hypothetical protein